jgi:uncharacterized protein YggE
MTLRSRSPATLALAAMVVASLVLAACASGVGSLRPPSENAGTPSSAPATSQPVVNPGLPVSGSRSAPAADAGSNGASGVNAGAPVAAPPVGIAQPAPALAPAPAIISSNSGAQAQVVPTGPVLETAPSRTIVVAGSGSATGAPDQAIVSAGVETRAPTAQAAQSSNNTTMQAVLAAIKALGIPDKNIQTAGISLYPIENQNQSISGYNASNTVTVIIDNVDQTGQVLDAAVNAGANQSVGVRFAIKNSTDLRNKALTAAAADARQKADALAAAYGLTISGVNSISEQSVGGPIVSQPRALAAGAAAPSVPIEPGELTVNAQVTVTFGY